MEKLQKQYDEVIAEIAKLQKRKRKLEKQMINSAVTFMDKFRIWYFNDNDGHHDYIIDSPHLRALLDGRDYNRYQTIELERLIGDDDFQMLINPEEFKECFDSEEEFQKEYDELLTRLQPALQEAMDTNMKSFELDW